MVAITASEAGFLGKVVANADGEPRSRDLAVAGAKWGDAERRVVADVIRTGAPVLAKEVGLSRYERIVGFDDSAGRRYQERTEPFWAEVRAAWADVARRHATFTMRAPADQGQLFLPLFEYAAKLDEGAPYDPAGGRAFARRAVAGYLVGADAPH